ncbi:hypothetical protein QIG42_26785, partial [Klebsiella pneumoniae]|nr:hypothetical protein [Klebsiella pneumoniae]
LHIPAKQRSFYKASVAIKRGGSHDIIQERASPILEFIDVQSAEKRSPVTAATRSRRKTTISTVSNKQ